MSSQTFSHHRICQRLLAAAGCALACGVLLGEFVAPASQAPEREVTVVISTPLSPPAWALMQRELLRQASLACEEFVSRYVDERGYFAHTPRWGALDGPDDILDTFWNWSLLHALGGADSLLRNWSKIYDGHLLQYAELKTTTTDLAKDGAYYKEYITHSDWFHIGEGMRGFYLQGLSDPEDRKFRERMKRYAGLYLNEDPEAANYDPEKRIIRSFFNGSKGPVLRQLTEYDWAGDPLEGKFHFLHSIHGRQEMLDFKEQYPRMLAHFTEYVDAEGDSFLNLAATILAANAFMLTGEEKYRDWVIDYLDAWRRRTEACGGNIPSVVGVDGVPGSNHGGQWWKGTYGWNFTIFDGEVERIVHRNYLYAGTWPGFANGLLLTGRQEYIDVLRRQIDNLYAQEKVENGRILLPRMYGDPRGYRYSGPPEWYHYSEDPPYDRLTEIYLWSMERRDLERIPKEEWIGFLEGDNPRYPEEALSLLFEDVRERLHKMRTDPTTAETRLADYLIEFNPASTRLTDTLTSLMLGGYFASGRIRMLHSRFRFFDPGERRAGLPEDVAALVEKLSAESATLVLVNVNQSVPRSVVVQAGGYREHHFDSVEVDGKTTRIDSPLLVVKLEPGSGARLVFQMARYRHAPRLDFTGLF